MFIAPGGIVGPAITRGLMFVDHQIELGVSQPARHLQSNFPIRIGPSIAPPGIAVQLAGSIDLMSLVRATFAVELLNCDQHVWNSSNLRCGRSLTGIQMKLLVQK